MRNANSITIFIHSVLFVLGFSLVFVVGWGGSATLLGQLFGQSKTLLSQIGGAFVILFGLHTLDILRILWLSYDLRPQWTYGAQRGYVSSGLMGIFFAAGWTPCIGVTLGAILTLGLSQQSAGEAMVLASGYALGLGIPFLALGMVVARVVPVIARIKPHIRKIQMATGIFLILIGIMLLTNRMTLIAIWAQRNGLFLDLNFGGASIPTYPIAILAGLLSFLSPCVLPLVPAYLGYLSRAAMSPFSPERINLQSDV